MPQLSAALTYLSPAILFAALLITVLIFFFR